MHDEQHLHVHFHADEILTQFMKVFFHDFHQLTEKVISMALSLDDIKNSDADLAATVDQLLTLADANTAKLDALVAAGGTIDPAQIQAILDANAAEKQKIVDRVTADTRP